MTAIEYIYNTGLLKELIDKNHCKACYFDDLEQEIYLILAKYSNDELQGMIDRKEINFFLVKIIKNQYHSTTSSFYNKYRKYYNFTSDNQYIEQDEEDETDD